MPLLLLVKLIVDVHIAFACRFYLKKFENYPKNRKAFIPFIL